MSPLAISFLMVAFFLGGAMFRLAKMNDWPLVVGIFLAVLPLTVTYFFGLIGLLGSAVLVGSLYKSTD